MARSTPFDTSFNFGANAKAKKKSVAKKKAKGKQSDAWRNYVGTGKRR